MVTAYELTEEARSVGLRLLRTVQQPSNGAIMRRPEVTGGGRKEQAS
jgi:hypothetical protein